MRSTAFALAALVALAGPPPVEGAEFTAIQFSLEGSTLMLHNPLEGMASATGTATIALQSSGGVPFASGSVQVLTFHLFADSLMIFSHDYVTGAVGISLLAPFNSGHLTANHGVFGGIGAVGTMLLTGFMHCSDTVDTCNSVGMPVSIPMSLGELGVTVTLPFFLGPFTAPPVSIGPLQFSSAGNFDSFTQQRMFGVASIALVGTEISRSTVDLELKAPEPGSLGLIGAGALGLGLLAFARRRRT